ncbi:MAG TPA: sigma-70 family RNA polymerase sigma factor [Polyangiaceae bacterium]
MTVRDSPEVLARFQAELDLVDIVARQTARRMNPAVTVDDLRSFGREGLLQAARAYDPSRGVPFRRWANVRVRGAMIDGVRQWGALPRQAYRELKALEAGDALLEQHDEDEAARPAQSAEDADSRLSAFLAGMATAIALGSMGETETYDTPEEQLGNAEMLERIRIAVAKLPDQERHMVERHYFKGERLDQAAAALGLSKSWGSRLHARAIELITESLQASGDI